MNQASGKAIGIPPHNLQAEQSALACMWLQNDLLDDAEQLLSVGDFYSEFHRKLYQASLDLRRDGAGVDLVSLSDKLYGWDGFHEFGGAAALVEILETVPYAAHYLTYVKAIKDKAAARRVLNVANSVILQINSGISDPAEAFSRLAETISTASESVSLSVKPQYRVMTSAELDAADIRTEFIIEKFIVRNQPGILAAPKKSMKTTVACDVALSAGSGSKCLGKFYTPRAVRTCLMSGESGQGTIQETVRRIARSKPWIDPKEYVNCIWSDSLPKLGTITTKRDLTRFIKSEGLELLIIDPAYLCLDIGDDAGNLFKVGPKLMELTEIMADTGCTIILIHHCKKSTNDPFAIPELEGIAWSGFQEWARQWILINRRERYDPEQAGSHKLWVTAGGSAGHSGCWALDIEEGSIDDTRGRRWDVEVRSASSAVNEAIEYRETIKEERQRTKEERQADRDSEKLLAQYRKHPEGNTASFFISVAGLSGNRGKAANHKLFEAGIIEAVKIAKSNNQKYDGFRLSKNHSDTLRHTPTVGLSQSVHTHTPTTTCKGSRSGGVCDEYAF